MDERIIDLFARIGGSTVFSVVDSMGNTPLHSLMRAETDVGAIAALIRAYPGALSMKTIYGDTPLHLACIRKVHHDVVREVALASSAGGRNSPILSRNTAGQNPIEIAMEVRSSSPFVFGKLAT